MNHPFQILAGFLDRHTDEVEGHCSEEPSAELRDQFQQFAAGTLPEPDRLRVVGLLKDHPHWLSLLADEVKARRTGKP